MSDLYQDITITLCLNDMTPKKYKAIMRELTDLSIVKPNTYTYDPEECADELSEEHRELLNKLRKQLTIT